MTDKKDLRSKIKIELSDKYKMSAKMSDILSDIILAAFVNDYITTSMVTSDFSLDERNARRYLVRLVDYGYLVAEGENKNKKYRIVKSADK